MVSEAPRATQLIRPTKESAPYSFMVSIINPLAPLPLNDFISAVGKAPTKLVMKEFIQQQGAISVIEIKHLSKTFQMKDGAVNALKNIDLTIPDGSI